MYIYWERISPLETVFSGYAQDTADFSHVEGFASILLSGTRSPCLAAVQQCINDTGVVDIHFCIHCQLVVYPNTSCEQGDCCSVFPVLLVDICVEGNVVGDSGADVHKPWSVQSSLVMMGVACVICQDVRLLQAEGQSEVLSGWERSGPSATGVSGCVSQLPRHQQITPVLHMYLCFGYD